MRLLELGGVPCIARCHPEITDFYCTRAADDGPRLTIRRLLQLRTKLRAGEYDLVIYNVHAKVSAPWHRAPTRVRGLVQTVIWSFTSFDKVGWHFFHWILCGTQVPLVIIDKQDTARITKTESRWLDRCSLWFMRELPPNHLHLFLNMDRRCGDVINVRRRKELRRNFHKIRSYGLGFETDEVPVEPQGAPPEKIHDVFYAGANHTTSVRERGFEELKALRASDLRIFLPESRLSQADFYRACAQSWLVWSPEGQGWDCYRHAEALLWGSVPVINSRTIELLWPLEEGRHCFYYPPEPGGLTRIIHRALQDKALLRQISAEGRAYVVEHYRPRTFARHVFAEIGLLERIEPYLSPR